MRFGFVWFGSVWFGWFLKDHPNQTKQNQCGYDRFGGGVLCHN
jgi:hypothetical protein